MEGTLRMDGKMGFRVIPSAQMLEVLEPNYIMPGSSAAGLRRVTCATIDHDLSRRRDEYILQPTKSAFGVCRISFCSRAPLISPKVTLRATVLVSLHEMVPLN